MKTVAHFIRKNTQLKASFVQNQILNHKQYKPVIVYKYKSVKDDEGFANYDYENLKQINLSSTESFWDRLLYKFLKKISRKQAKLIKSHIKKNNRRKNESTKFKSISNRQFWYNW